MLTTLFQAKGQDPLDQPAAGDHWFSLLRDNLSNKDKTFLLSINTYTHSPLLNLQQLRQAIYLKPKQSVKLGAKQRSEDHATTP